MKIKLKFLLLFVNFYIIIFIGVLFFLFQFYNNELIRQTEAELISQAASISSVYTSRINKFDDLNTQRRVLKDLQQKDHPYRPYPPKLVYKKDKILPPRPETVENLKILDTSTRHNELNDILVGIKNHTLSGIRIVDLSGHVVSGTSELGHYLGDIEEIKCALNGDYCSVLREKISNDSVRFSTISRSNKYRVFVAFPIIKDNFLYGAVYLSRTPLSFLKHFYNQKSTLVKALVIVFFLGLISSLAIAYLIIEPVNVLKSAMMSYRKNPNEKIIIGDSRIEEFSVLNRQFQELVENLNNRSEYIYKFATSLSHELKTPLTAIKGSVELLADHAEQMSEEDKNRFINNIVTDVDRTSILLGRLIDLAKADSTLSSSESTDLQNVLENIELRFENRIDIESVGGHLKLPITTTALETILINLLENSCAHGADTVHLSVSNKDSLIELRVKDNGEGIDPLKQDLVFQPFYTTRREKGGTGVGLQIVKSLLNTFDGGIKLVDTNQGAEFILSLPKVIL